MGITTSDWLMMLAVISGPVIAVQVQKYIDRRLESKNRKLKVFSDLMTTRASTLALQHVSALNMVGLEFNDKAYDKVLNAWKIYLDHLSSFPVGNESLQSVWGDKRNDLLSDLLYEMGESLGFNFDKVHIKKAGYIPQAYADQEVETKFIRKQLVEVLSNRSGLSMSITSFPSDDEALEVQKELQKIMKVYYEKKVRSSD